MVAACRGECRGAEVELQLEAEQPDVEVDAALHVADVQVQVPHPEPRRGSRYQRLVRRQSVQAVEVEGHAGDVHVRLHRPRPLLLGPVPGELEAVAVRVG